MNLNYVFVLLVFNKRLNQVTSQNESSLPDDTFGDDSLAFVIDDSVELRDFLVLFLNGEETVDRLTFIGVFIVAIRFVAKAFRS